MITRDTDACDSEMIRIIAREFGTVYEEQYNIYALKHKKIYQQSTGRDMPESDIVPWFIAHFNWHTVLPKPLHSAAHY